MCLAKTCSAFQYLQLTMNYRDLKHQQLVPLQPHFVSTLVSLHLRMTWALENMIQPILSHAQCALVLAIGSILPDEKSQMKISSVGWEESNPKTLKTHDILTQTSVSPEKVASKTKIFFPQLLEVLLLKKGWRRVHSVVTITWIYSHGFPATVSSCTAWLPSLDGWGQCQQPQPEATQVAQSSDQLLQVMPC